MLTIKRFIFNPVQENTYVLSNGKDACCIIDPGCYFPGEKETLAAWLASEQLIPKLLLNTHCHLDHVFGNKWVAEKYGLKLQIGEKEQWTFDYAPKSGDAWGMPFENYAGELIHLADGDIIHVGGKKENELEVLFTPGHSVGHVVFYNREQGFVIGGDVLFRNGIGRTDIPGGDSETLLRSIKEKLYTLPDETIVYPGHGDPTTIGYEKEFNQWTVDS
ncbi:MAG: MBL fold metallo-hydrolase [Bacteroidota bacterium]|nr:MBL fold metallo-hydrolase [Bacteroidota bacterium]